MKTTGIRPNLSLNRILGIRPDTNPVGTKVPFKKEIKLEQTPASKKLKSRTTKDGFKY
jgi:hypothetical protein